MVLIFALANTFQYDAYWPNRAYYRVSANTPREMYEGEVMSTRTTCGKAGECPVTIGLHQGYAF